MEENYINIFAFFFANGDGRRKTERRRNEFLECFYWQFLQWQSLFLSRSLSHSIFLS